MLKTEPFFFQFAFSGDIGISEIQGITDIDNSHILTLILCVSQHNMLYLSTRKNLMFPTQ